MNNIYYDLWFTFFNIKNKCVLLLEKITNYIKYKMGQISKSLGIGIPNKS